MTDYLLLFWAECLQLNQSIQTPKFFYKVVVHVIVIDQ